MDWRVCSTEDISQRSQMNRMLHEDEGAVPMELEDIEKRYMNWLGSNYTGVLFSSGDEIIGYCLFRPTDADSEGIICGVFIRQFLFIDPIDDKVLVERRFAFSKRRYGPKAVDYCWILPTKITEVRSFGNQWGFQNTV